MKIRLTETQYKVLLKEDRIDYLKGQILIDPKEVEKWEKTKDKPQRSGPEGEPVEDKKSLKPILDNNGKPIAFLRGGKNVVKLTPETFQSLVETDPSENKQYVQWMIDVFKKYVKEDLEDAIRFVTEDLDQATEALDIFHCVKDRKKFKINAPTRRGAPKNPKDIRQYDSVGQLYLVVSAFSCEDDDEDDVEGGEGQLSKKGKELYNQLVEYQKLGQANLIKVSDRLLIYQPQTLVSNCEVLGNLASWCTRATPSGGIDPETGKYRGESGSEYFYSYRGEKEGNSNRRKPDGSVSDYYVIMPIEIFQLPNPSSHDYYPLQFHFESHQFMHKGNGSIGIDGVNKLIGEYPEVGEFFRKELGGLAAQEIRGGTGLMDSQYIKHLNEFGGKVEEYVPKEAYAEGVESIKKLAIDERGPVNNNKYLKWLLSNEDGIDIIDYIPLDINTLDFSNINLGQIPDLSMFTEATDLQASKCNLTTLPLGSQLPPKLSMISLHDNQISDLTFEGWGENLPDTSIINLFNNPIKHINLENLENLFVKAEELVRIAISSPSEMENYYDYKNAVGNGLSTDDPEYIAGKFEELSPGHGIMFDV